MSKLIIVTSALTAACVATSDPQIETSTQLLTADACPAGIPATLAPAADQHLAFVLDAIGVQKYSCNALGAWVFVAPDADVYHDNQAFIHHYAGPTWEWLDGSTAVAAKVAGATVDSSAIPWLLLRVTSHGPIEGKMTDITSIQRVDTVGGLAPTGTCTAGDSADVPYTAKYVFYRTKTDHPENNTRCGAL
jgi:hypothetical protein